MRKNGTTLLLLCFFLVAGWNGLPVANAGDPYEDPGDKDTIGEDPDTQEVPLDSGLVFLLAAGAVYGLKKYNPGFWPKQPGSQSKKA